MFVEYRENHVPKGDILKLVRYLEAHDGFWEYKGMKVEIDPTVDFEDQNVLVRWTDVNEGFNDKIIVNSLEEFKKEFSFIE